VHSEAPPLADLKRSDGDSMMSANSQQKTIQEIAAKKAAEEAEALKQIQQTH